MAGQGVPSGIVKAADLSQFQPGNIISDAVFFNPGTMTEAQIQTFLEQRVPRCESGYVCLKDWYDTSRTTNADAMCGAYSGGVRERASRIIFKVAQACGINPQVILATLQKEQGLVTHVWPSDWRYTIAMGQGCPDTAACDTRYYGFFNQVYGAAWQFKRYANPPGTSNYFNWYAPGKTWNLRYHPNVACGASPVYIQNQATANLYYYTPYQPNAAALAAGYAAANNACSSYGNRNFFNYFTDWFGSTQRDVPGEIEAEYRAQGGQAGLGAPLTGVLPLSKNGGGYGRAYALGSIYWSYDFGAKTVRQGAIRDYYFARGGADGDMGWPALNYQLISGSGVSGAGQLFSEGSLYSSALGTYIVREPLRSAYFTQTGAAGPMGWPTADQVCGTNHCIQSFQQGVVISSGAGAFPVVGATAKAYQAAGGPAGTWGVPLMGPTSLAYSGGGFGQAFAGGSAYWRSDGVPHFVTGPIRDRYFAQGGAAGALGYPVRAMDCQTASSCRQQFQFGWILWTSAAGTRIGDPAIDASYTVHASSLGHRTGAFAHYAANGGGFAEGFVNGTIYFKPGVGAFAVGGAIRDAYFARGGAVGALGWPVSDQACPTQTSCRQKFEGGWLLWTAGEGARLGDPAIDDAYARLGGTQGVLGPRAGTVVSYAYNGGGLAEGFAKGAVFYKPALGAFGLYGSIRDAYFARGGAAGVLGWPKGDQICITSTSCRQQFEGAWIFWTAPNSTRLGDPVIDAAYAAAGESRGALGGRLGTFAAYSYNGGGFAEGFVNGAIFYKPSRGAFAVTGALRDAYFAGGGAAGRYGWPTGTMVCSAGVCSQAFEGGTITAGG